LSELQIKLINDEENFCTICFEPFEWNNGKFKTEVIEEEMIQDHKLHESEFHQSCIEKWMENKTSCPICRKTLKEKFSANTVRKMIKSRLCNLRFWWPLIEIFSIFYAFHCLFDMSRKRGYI
jgi:hypothetical protein